MKCFYLFVFKVPGDFFSVLPAENDSMFICINRYQRYIGNIFLKEVSPRVFQSPGKTYQ